MKKYVLLTFVAFLMIFAITSCTKNTDTSIDAFKTDNLITEISKTTADYKFALANKGQAEIRKAIDKLVSTSNQLVSKYGKENVDNYLLILIKEERLSEEKNITTSSNVADPDGDKCHRNDNGTTNWDDCNFWESIVVSVASMTCGTIDGYSTSSQIESYYNCVQSKICNKC